MVKKLPTILLLILVLFGCQQETPEKTEKGNNIEINSGLLSPDNVLNIAHRGASGHAPEHTMAAYEMGEEMGADYIEIDLQMTEDDELIAMHDEDVSRTTDSEGEVGHFTLEDMTGLDAGSWFNQAHPSKAQTVFQDEHVLSLEEIFDRFGHDANYYIETKFPETSPNMVDELFATLEKHDLLDDTMDDGHVLIQSCSKDSLKEVHERDDTIPLIQLVCFGSIPDTIDKELADISEYAIGIGANHKYLSKEYVQRVRDAGLLMHPYTVNQKSDMKRLLDWGATGFFTNYPDRLNDVLEEMDEEGEMDVIEEKD